MDGLYRGAGKKKCKNIRGPAENTTDSRGCPLHEAGSIPAPAFQHSAVGSQQAEVLFQQEKSQGSWGPRSLKPRHLLKESSY